MNNNWNNTTDPWERDTYQTGSTTPPKNHGGMIALLLALTICLSGMLSILALMKVQFFQDLGEPAEDTSPLSINIPDNTDSSVAQYNTQQGIGHIDTQKTTEPAGTNGITIGKTQPGVENIPQEGGLSLQAIYAKCIPSVVSISCQFYGATSTGTGVILSREGYIVTNAHVVENAISIQVILTSGSMLEARLVGADTVSDLAVLWVDHEHLTPAELGNSDMLRVGDAVVAIGDPMGVVLRGTMTEGIISGINRDIPVNNRTMTLIQTNAALNEGNSGGPLINCYGQVIGINTMKIGDSMSTAGVEGLGFAIPSTTVREIVDQLINQGYVSGRPDLGLEGQAVSLLYQLYGRLPSGLYLTQVDSGSDAYAKGIREDDVLMSMNGVRITNFDEYETQLYACEVGEEITVVIYRDGRQYELTLTVGEAGA